MIYRCKCEVCGHEWIPRSEGLPKRCGNRKCQVLTWNKRTTVETASYDPDAQFRRNDMR